MGNPDGQYDLLYATNRIIEVACRAHFRRKIFDIHTERAMRSIAIGRKNWLFAGSKAGGERAAAIYTVIETCKLSGVEPQAYIAHVIAKIAGNWPAARWDELMP